MMLTAAFSPCPNDTFLFHGAVEGLVDGIKLSPVLADIEELNRSALQRTYPLTKLSLSTFAKVQDDYMLLPVGAALTTEGGPKLVGKTTLAALPSLRVALPGKETTAHFLLNHLLPPPADKIFCPYYEILPFIHSGKADAGVIIHESRFIFAREGLTELTDLGTLWHRRYNLPLPLGALALRRDYSHIAEPLTATLRRSLRLAHTNPSLSRSFILAHSIEKDEEIVSKHIALYVNDETYALSPEGERAIQLLDLLCN